MGFSIGSEFSLLTASESAEQPGLMYVATERQDGLTALEIA